MRNVFALLLSTAIHAAIAAFVWHVSTHLPEPEPKFQPFDLNMLTVEAPPPAPPAETVAENPGMPEAQPAAQPAAPPPPPPLPKAEPEPEPEPPVKPEPKPEPKPKEKKPKDKPKEKIREKPKEKPKEKPRRQKKTAEDPRPEVREAPPRVEIDAPPPAGNQPLFNPNSRQSAPAAQTGTPGGAVKGQPSAPGKTSGGTPGGADAKRAYQNGLRKAIERNKPRRTSDKGTAVVAFTVEGSGAFGNIRLQQSSGNPELDDAALQAVRNTGRYEPPPGGQAMSVAVPIQFRVR